MARFYRILTWFCAGFIIMWLQSCSTGSQKQDTDGQRQTLYIIHAGSLSYPVKVIGDAFMHENPGVRILSEAWGSKAGARRVMELESPADVFMSADYRVIKNMLIPDHASWYMAFAANELAIVYTAKSKFAEKITGENWYHILLKPEVHSGRSDPDHDPCGVRTVFAAKLAEIFYKEDGLAEALLSKAGENIRPKETDLIALLESGHLDYIYLYRSVAQQHQLRYLKLPYELNLGEPSLADWYAQVSTQTMGNRPGHRITEIGEPMVYGLTIPHKSTNVELAQKFVDFVMDRGKGQRILDELGQPPLAPAVSGYFEHIPEQLKMHARPIPVNGLHPE